MAEIGDVAAVAAHAGAASPAAMRPLCVSLNGTLLRTDLLHEQLLHLTRRHPLRLLAVPGWLMAGRATLKRNLAAESDVDLDTLPRNDGLIDYLTAEHARGRELALLSGVDEGVVRAVADRLGIFAWSRGSDGREDLDGPRKLEAMRAAYGDGFAYAGNGRADLPLWRGSQGALVAGAACRHLPEIERSAPVEASFPYGPVSLSERSAAWLRALRPHQWAKNLLVLLPVALAGPLAGLADLGEAALGFLIFGLLASAGYVVNDLLDLEADRRHRTKRLRPFAAGDLSIGEGVLGAAALVALAALLLGLMPLPFAGAACAYFAGTLVYSLALKREPMLDTLALASLFTVRVFAGAMVLAQPMSFWLLTFSMFLFFSLAMVKRYTELAELARRRPDEAVAGRGYTVAELPLVLSAGVAAAVAATMIFVVYLVEEKFPTGIYTRPQWLWLIFPLLTYWIMRVWRLAVLDRLHEDPVLFALRDRLSLAMGAVMMGLVLLAR